MRFSDNGARQLTQDAKPKWVFTPGMSAVGKSLIAARPQWNIHTGCAVDAVTGVAGAWVLSAGEQRFGPFAHVVLPYRRNKRWRCCRRVQALAML